MSQAIRIATRQSPLALWQANFVKHALERSHSDISVELLGFTTRGDKILDSPLSKVGGKGLFVKELEQAMLAGEADIAVHSMKDVPMEFPDGLELAVICERENPFDAFVSNRYASFAALPQGARVGTSSLRRQCQLRAKRPDLQILDLRGNVNTRLRKLDDGEYDAIILACAGLIRLDMAERIRETLSPELSLPAGGQGAVGIELRSNDARCKQLLASLHHPQTAQCVEAERALNTTLQGGCQVPIACFALPSDTANLDKGALWLRGLVGSSDGRQILEAQAWGDDPKLLGKQVAQMLLDQGAGEILSQVYGN